MLEQVSVIRYVTPLREGGSLPALVEADNLGTYVLKFRGAGQGPKALALTAHASTSLALLPGLALAGFGIGMVLVPLTATALANMAAEHAGAASGVLATGLQVGGALMIAVIGVCSSARSAAARSPMRSHPAWWCSPR